MGKTLTALDAMFLELEQLDEGALMSIGGVMVFDPLPGGGVPSVEEVCADLLARLGQLPRYSQKLSSTRTGRFAWPHWIDDEQFDIRDHVRHAALPAPCTDAQLCDWAADFYSHRLDRTRPLWEIAGRGPRARPLGVGPQDTPLPLYAFGAPIREVYPLVPLAAEHAVGIAIFSYNGLVVFGIAADCDSTPDLAVLADGIEEGIEELLAMVPDRELPSTQALPAEPAAIQ
ncbi:MAG: wax ester/triacylglycerol synthase domain-containing protein [Solirubrobacteraceae bacterium]